MLANLLEYAKREGIEAEAGFGRKTIIWIVKFSENGDFLGVLDRTPEGSKRRGREATKAPHLRFSGDTPMRQFLVDTLKYALLFGEDDPSAKLLAKHEFFLQLLRNAAVCGKLFGVIAKAIADSATRAKICDKLAEQDPKAKPVDNVSFAVVVSGKARVLVEEDGWHDWWRGHFPTLLNRDGDSDDPPMRCLLTGELDEIADTHPKIKGLGNVGGNIETTLVSFNKDAFCSYGLEQSRNAAISKDAAQQYVAALNHAIARGVTMPGTKIAFWYDQEIPTEYEFITEVIQGFGDAPVAEPGDEDELPTEREVAQETSKARKFLTALSTGKCSTDLGNARFNALTLSGNSGRVVVRDWMEGQFKELAEKVEKWFQDLAIVRRDGQGVVHSHKFAAVVAGTVRDLKDAAAPMVSGLWHAAICGQPIPYEAVAQTLARVRIDVINDESARHARLGLLKAFWIRREKGKGIAMTPELNETFNHPAYLCGRLMAILAQIQYRALGDVGAGVVQRYYAAASTTPALVLGRLVRLAQVGHLPKIEGGLGHWFDQQLGDVWNLFKERPPTTLSLEEQTLFALGYYQQKAKRKDKASDTDATENSETKE